MVKPLVLSADPYVFVATYCGFEDRNDGWRSDLTVSRTRSECSSISIYHYNIRHRLFDRTASGPKAGVARHDIGHDRSEGVKRVRER